jgi:hypothetical protein
MLGWFVTANYTYTEAAPYETPTYKELLLLLLLLSLPYCEFEFEFGFSFFTHTHTKTKDKRQVSLYEHVQGSFA